MPTPTPTTDGDDTKLAVQLAIILGVSLLLLNVLFYFLSGLYYDDKRATEGMMSTITSNTVSSTRLSFAIFTGVTTATLIAALFAAKWVGHVVAALLGVAAMIAAVAAMRAAMPAALSGALIVIGLLYPSLAVLSLLRRSRAAWAFLCAMCWVFGIVMLFGAPKIRTQVNIGLWTAMIIPGLLFATGIALTMARRDYRERH